MNDDLLTLYNRELAYFRRLSGDFAAQHPKIAGRLRLGADTSEDPHVERLIEAFAFLTARIRHKLDDDFPELSESLLQLLYPHYLRPIPSTAIAQYTLDESQTALTAGLTIDAGAGIHTEPVDGEPIYFRSTYPVTLWPLQVVEGRVSGMPVTAPQTPKSGQAVAVASLHLQTLGAELPVSDLETQSLRFYLGGQALHAFALYELLLNNTLELALARSPNDPDPVVLPASTIQPVGFAEDEGLVPYPPHSGIAYRLLTEFFTFPQKFLFVDFTGLDLQGRSGFGPDLYLYAYLNRSIVEVEQNVDADSFRIGCTPIVNLFEQRAEPIGLDPTVYEHQVAPDARRPLALEVYSVDSVFADNAEGEETEVRPFYSISHGEDATGAAPYWHAARRRVPSGDPTDRGYEVFLSLTGLDQDRYFADGCYLTVNTTCTNRDLPSRLPFGGGEPRLHLTEGEGVVSEVLCLSAPTPTQRPAGREAVQWKLISHLSLDHLSITGGEQAASAIREVLKLYDLVDSEESRRMIDGVSSVGSRLAVGRAPGGGPGSICKGVEIELELDGEKFGQNQLFLFASVLERFLAGVCTTNSFSRLSVRRQGDERMLRRWPPRSGTKVLL